MKQRVISAIFIVLITAAACLLGGYFLMAVCAFINIWGSKEVINLKKDYKSKSLFITMCFSTLLICFGPFIFDFDIQTIIVLVEPIVLCSIAVFNERINFEDVGTTFIMSMIIGYSTYYFIYFDNFSKYLFAYVIIISYVADACALFAGMLFGKHKLNERISPKKTIEGFIGGWILGGLVSFLFAYIFNFFYMDIRVIIIGSITLPLLSQIGDLVFSLIKRHYEVKDYSNLIPGHGGLLDRLDSLFITTLFLGAICLVLV